MQSVLCYLHKFSFGAERIMLFTHHVTDTSFNIVIIAYNIYDHLNHKIWTPLICSYCNPFRSCYLLFICLWLATLIQNLFTIIKNVKYSKRKYTTITNYIWHTNCLNNLINAILNTAYGPPPHTRICAATKRWQQK